MPLFNVASVVSSFCDRAVEFHRPSLSIDEAGFPATSSSSVGTFPCSVQPIQGAGSQAKLEAISAVAGVMIWTLADLNAANQAGVAGDYCTIDGVNYEIRNKHDWASMGGYKQYDAGRLT